MEQVESNTAPVDNSVSIQREQVFARLVDVQARLEKKGLGAAFHRVAKADTVGDMGFLGSLMFHAMMCGPLEQLAGEFIPGGHGELDSTLALATMDAISALNDTQDDRHKRRPKSAFYPLGRKQSKVKEADTQRKTAGTSAFTANGRLSNDVQGELAFMFELLDTLNSLEAKEASQLADKRLHLVIKQPSTTPYNGVERRRRPRPEGMFSA